MKSTNQNFPLIYIIKYFNEQKTFKLFIIDLFDEALCNYSQ